MQAYDNNQIHRCSVAPGTHGSRDLAKLTAASVLAASICPNAAHAEAKQEDVRAVRVGTASVMIVQASQFNFSASSVPRLREKERHVVIRTVLGKCSTLLGIGTGNYADAMCELNLVELQ
jgi:hypothetical protein